MKSSPIRIQACRGVSVPYFKIKAPFFVALSFQEISPPLGQDQLNGSPSESTSRIHPLIFL